VKPYLQILRVDHWFKNLFILPGVATAWLLAPVKPDAFWWNFFAGMLCACLTASANYVINEYLDRESDREHPEKRDRPSALGLIKLRWVLVEYSALTAASLALAWAINGFFFAVTIWFLAMGVIYNVKPIRSKDLPYVDVLSESINNPIRFLLGWAMVMPLKLPPSSILMSYWFGGAFLMAVKRFAEFRQIGDAAAAGAYRPSFRHYTEDRLLLSAVFYALNATFFLAVFLVKYRVEFLLTFPLFSLLFAWYLKIGYKPDSAAQHPERLYRERAFMGYVILLTLVVLALFFVDVPALQWFLRKNFY
jgi:4-hydroxybenzoate polyprenyltransferase